MSADPDTEQEKNEGNLQKEKRKIIRKMFRLRWTENRYSLQKTLMLRNVLTQELNEEQTTYIFGHIMRFVKHRLTKRTVTFVASRFNGEEWIKNVTRGIDLAKISKEETVLE